MTIGDDDRRALAELDFRLRTILPEEYHEIYDQVRPVSMGSAGLKFAADGSVAWNEMWGSFCDLAMAGGPPHKGSLLEPAPRADVEAWPDRYQEVVDEIGRGVTMVTDLPADASPIPGWIRVDCYSEAMAAWLLRAILMENVAARADGRALDLPASPAFRLHKEIKNVITVIAKTCHYYVGHMPREQKQAIAILFASLGAESPLLAPGEADIDALTFDVLAERIHQGTGLRVSHHRYAGWLGVDCPNVRAAVWMMRALVVSNVLSRREGVTLFVPINPVSDPDGDRVRDALARIHRLAAAQGVL